MKNPYDSLLVVSSCPEEQKPAKVMSAEEHAERVAKKLQDELEFLLRPGNPPQHIAYVEKDIPYHITTELAIHERLEELEVAGRCSTLVYSGDDGQVLESSNSRTVAVSPCGNRLVATQIYDTNDHHTATLYEVHPSLFAHD